MNLSRQPFTQREGKGEREWDQEKKIFLDSTINLQYKNNFFIMAYGNLFI